LQDLLINHADLVNIHRLNTERSIWMLADAPDLDLSAAR